MWNLLLLEHANPTTNALLSTNTLYKRVRWKMKPRHVKAFFLVARAKYNMRYFVIRILFKLWITD